MRKVGTVCAEVDASKILEDSEDSLVVPAIIAREGVYPYPEGNAFKPAEELRQAVWTAEGAWVVPERHPDTLIVTKPDDVAGRIEDPRFDEEIKGIRANLRIWKKKVSPQFLEDVKAGRRKDVSIGFFYDFDPQTGEWNGQRYDFVQRNILIDHVAAGVPVGRCSSPLCGIAVDSLIRKIALDPWEETDDYIRSGHKEPGETCRTINISEDEGIKAIYCKYGDSWDIQSYLFAKAKGWTLEKAKAWFAQHQKAADAEWTTEYVNNLPDSCFAYIEPGGEKDEEGKTKPRSLRHLPYKNAQGEIDRDHLINALARVRQSATLPEGGKREAIEKLCAAVRSWNREHPDDKIESEVCGTAGDCLTLALQQVERSKSLFQSHFFKKWRTHDGSLN